MAANDTMEVQSLHRALNILEAVGRSETPLSLKQLTAITGLPKPTVYRLLRNLEDRNYVTCDNSGKYRLGLQVLSLSRWAEQDFEVKLIARPHLAFLSELSKETVHLAILEQNRVLYVDTVESPHALRLVTKLGSTNSVHCTALGKALLMKHSDQEILALLASQEMERRTEYTITTPVDFLSEMQTVRAKGYALDERESELEGRCVGAPIYDHTGTIIAAISISGLSTRFSAEHIKKNIVPHLLERTAQLSRTLGYRD
ncbi:IclR family transcriptional regulator [Sporomusaceae bacterium FL31]|nr:IclR family transcriptional regulator [Sporomusaceae bacterium FL31]GCE32952.1 IclR family transcriptional regulator [Sporomusaceae bacterium]